MSDSVKCRMSGCDGVLDKETRLLLQTSCTSGSIFYACGKCGRVQSDGGLVFNRPGAAVYLRGNRIVHEMEPKEFTPGKKYLTDGYTSAFKAELSEDEAWYDMVELEPGVSLIFDGMKEEFFLFHTEDGLALRLHRGDINHIEDDLSGAKD